MCRFECTIFLHTPVLSLTILSPSHAWAVVTTPSLIDAAYGMFFTFSERTFGALSAIANAGIESRHIAAIFFILRSYCRGYRPVRAAYGAIQIFLFGPRIGRERFPWAASAYFEEKKIPPEHSKGGTTRAQTPPEKLLVALIADSAKPTARTARVAQPRRNPYPANTNGTTKNSAPTVNAIGLISALAIIHFPVFQSVGLEQFDGHIVAALIAHNHIGLAVVFLSVEEHTGPVCTAITGVVIFSHRHFPVRPAHRARAFSAVRLVIEGRAIVHVAVQIFLTRIQADCTAK
ncbi:exported hypothetical protein [Paraburkholderia tropica]|nr:exported hypothetical protein [Paraburkholderia tropica]